jgi:hypothetical protein
MKITWALSVIFLMSALTPLTLGTPMATADIALVAGPTGVSTPNEAELLASTFYLDQAGFTGNDVSALTTPEQFTNASFETGDTDIFNTVEADYHAGDFSATDPLYLFGYSQSATEISTDMSDFATGTAPGTTTSNPADIIPSADLHVVFVGNPASDPDNVGGMAGVDGYDNVYGPEADEWGFTAMGGVTTPNDLYPTTSFALPGDNWAIASDAYDLGPTEHLEYYGLPYQSNIETLLADATQVHTGLTDYITIPDAGLNQFSALIDAFDALIGITP